MRDLERRSLFHQVDEPSYGGQRFGEYDLSTPQQKILLVVI